eukprot:2995928-Pleurochrysis_carterae.AAC.2
MGAYLPAVPVAFPPSVHCSSLSPTPTENFDTQASDRDAPFLAAQPPSLPDMDDLSAPAYLGGGPLDPDSDGVGQLRHPHQLRPRQAVPPPRRP